MSFVQGAEYIAMASKGGRMEVRRFGGKEESREGAELLSY